MSINVEWNEYTTQNDRRAIGARLTTPERVVYAQIGLDGGLTTVVTELVNRRTPGARKIKVGKRGRDKAEAEALMEALLSVPLVRPPNKSRRH